jgi:hypothetical protein
LAVLPCLSWPATRNPPSPGAEQLPGLRCRPEPLLGPPPPPFPEALEGGLKRYGRAVQRLAWAFPRLNLLLVSHGEVRCRAAAAGGAGGQALRQHSRRIRGGGSGRIRAVAPLIPRRPLPPPFDPRHPLFAPSPMALRSPSLCGAPPRAPPQCVRAVVNMIEPRSEVFEVRHVGFATLQYKPTPPDGGAPDGGAPDGGPQAAPGGGGEPGWRLASSEAGETGGAAF